MNKPICTPAPELFILIVDYNTTLLPIILIFSIVFVSTAVVNSESSLFFCSTIAGKKSILEQPVDTPSDNFSNHSR